VTRIEFTVLGRPASKGSGRAILVKGRAIHVPSASDKNRRELTSWDTAVREAALRVVNGSEAPPFVGTPLAVHLVFRLVRPADHWGKNGLRPSAPVFPVTKPDAEKLVRGTLDPLIGILFDDDSRIVRQLVEKVYAAPGTEGATIVVEELLA